MTQSAVTFVYLGRSPAFGNFVAEFAAAAHRAPGLDEEFIIAGGTALSEALHATGVPFLAVPTFKTMTVPHIAMGYVKARGRILSHLEARRPQAMITLMPHVWSPLMGRRVQRLGIRYATVIHDAEPHPGDPTAWATRWLVRDARHADVAFTLSRAVAQNLEVRRATGATRIVPLFHPDLGADGSRARARREAGQPLRVLFFGRILAYKGLSLLIDAIELARLEGVDVTLGVAGVGPIGAQASRLAALGAEVVNRWLMPEEVDELLGRYDVMACSHVEASQSGVAALAFGHTMPVVATPVGGVMEQVIAERTGVLARDVSARGLADAFAEMARSPDLYHRIRDNLEATRSERSMDRFLGAMLEALNLGARETP